MNWVEEVEMSITRGADAFMGAFARLSLDHLLAHHAPFYQPIVNHSAHIIVLCSESISYGALSNV